MPPERRPSADERRRAPTRADEGRRVSPECHRAPFPPYGRAYAAGRQEDFPRLLHKWTARASRVLHPDRMRT